MKDVITAATKQRILASPTIERVIASVSLDQVRRIVAVDDVVQVIAGTVYCAAAGELKILYIAGQRIAYCSLDVVTSAIGQFQYTVPALNTSAPLSASR